MRAAEEADAAVVVVGTWSRDQGELWTGANATTGEHIDVSAVCFFISFLLSGGYMGRQFVRGDEGTSLLLEEVLTQIG